MRRHSLLAIAIVSLCGCTSHQLRRSTVHQVSTLTDLQHQVVLNNLAAFACNRDAVPFQANLESGTTQVSDSGSIAGQFITDPLVALGLSRGLVDEWSMVPVTDATALKLLRIAYRRAHGLDEDLYNAEPRSGFANKLAHDLKKQSGALDDVRSLNLRRPIETPPSRTLATDELQEWNRISSIPEGDRTRQQKERLRQLSEGPPIAPQHRWGQCHEQAYGLACGIPAENNYVTDAVFQERTIISTNGNRMVLEDEVIDEEFIGTVRVDPRDGKWVKADATTSNVPVKWDPEIGQWVRADRFSFMLATPAAAEIRRQVADINEDLRKIRGGWLGVGNKHDVPKCACYVGHHKGCNCECYVWVMPEHQAEFEAFTLSVLELSGLMKESQVLTVPGVRYSPTVNTSGGGFRR